MSLVNTSDIKDQLGTLNPLLILNQWLKEALKLPKDRKGEEPWAMSFSTSYRGRVSSRIVLLKQVRSPVRSNNGELVFYTNYLSRKGYDLQKNQRAGAVFYWPWLGRQIRVEGRVRKTSRRQSVLYWKSRSRQSQISQYLSKQSEEISNREELEELFRKTKKAFQGKTIPCPSHWGGYALHIQEIEFWLNRKHRLHDRFLFEKASQKRGWKVRRLFP